MRHATLIEPRASRPSAFLRQLLILALGLAIITGLLLSDVNDRSTPARQGFPQAHQSPSFMPETVRLRTNP